MMKFLVDEFPSLSDLKSCVQDPTVVGIKPKCEVAPMTILLILIMKSMFQRLFDTLKRLMENAKLTGNPQV